MSVILLIETSSINCSVAVCDGNKILAAVEKREMNIHASAITLFIEQALKESNKNLKDLNAIAVGKGPGSYTGLRIGVSTAKGLCYALNIPLIACQSLRTIFESAKEISFHQNAVYRPLLDARRMEVYTCKFDAKGNQIEDTNAVIIDEQTFKEETLTETCIYFGDGAEKTKTYYQHNENITYVDELYPSANYMHYEAIEKFNKSEFEDLVYFEPFYLKEFYFNK